MDLKALIQYIANSVKFWVIINEWQAGVHLRFGKIRRVVKGGMYLRIPIIDSYYVQAIRLQEIPATHISTLTKDGKCVTISSSTWYIIDDVKEFYNGYAEPNEVVSSIIRNAMVMTVKNLNFDELDVKKLQEDTHKDILSREYKGFNIKDFFIVTITDASTWRILKDDLYSQTGNKLDEPLV